MRIQGTSGATLVFSSDVGPCSGLIDAARDADLFMCESALLDPAQDEPDPARTRPHERGEAGAAARAAGARRLMLTHYRSCPEVGRAPSRRGRGHFRRPVTGPRGPPVRRGLNAHRDLVDDRLGHRLGALDQRPVAHAFEHHLLI